MVKQIYIFVFFIFSPFFSLVLYAQGVQDISLGNGRAGIKSRTRTEEFPLPVDWNSYPVLPDLNKREGLFKQYLFEVQENKKRWAQDKAMLPIALYVYQIKKQDTIFTISAKSSISVESIATLNRIEHSNGLPQDSSYILLPNNSGIFLPQNLKEKESRQNQSLDLPKWKDGIQNNLKGITNQSGHEPDFYQNLSAWERQLYKSRAEILFHRLIVGSTVYLYYPKGSFSSKERRYFLDKTLRSPVQQKFQITSPFGNREDPIRGHSSYHDGLDIRSPYGAPVYSIANGKVLDLGENKLYGLFVKILLDNKKEQVVLYGHLIAVLVSKGQRVNAGEIIGNSGQSGRSTGPHLHLSIFQKGQAIDPAPLFRGLY